MRVKSPRTRRTAGVRVKGRAAAVVQRVLRETTRQLSRQGYAALNIDAVAMAARVNKTTIYRRWPTKEALVAAALLDVSQRYRLSEATGTGDLRRDLTAILRRFIRYASTSEGGGLVRMMYVDRGRHDSLKQVVHRLKAHRRSAGLELLTRAIEEGHLPRGCPSALMMELLFTTISARLYAGEPLRDDDVSLMVDLVLSGGAAVGARARR